MVYSFEQTLSHLRRSVVHALHNGTANLPSPEGPTPPPSAVANYDRPSYHSGTCWGVDPFASLLTQCFRSGPRDCGRQKRSKRIWSRSALRADCWDMILMSLNTFVYGCSAHHVVHTGVTPAVDGSAILTPTRGSDVPVVVSRNKSDSGGVGSPVIIGALTIAVGP